MIPEEVQLFTTSGGALIYQIPMEAFPGLLGYAYFVLFEDYRVLIDTGSGFGDSNQHLESGLTAAGEKALQAGWKLPQPFTFADLSHILITHGHIDHFGGLTYVWPKTRARIGVHELDRRNLTNYEERLTVVAKRLNEFLIEAGTTPEQRKRLTTMYTMTKSLFRSVEVDFTYEAEGMKLGPFEFLHVPGHCAGHVVIRLHDILFSGDHVLQDTSPHQAPERLTLSTGLDHYLKSLDDLEAWAGNPRLTLGGHKSPITDLLGRMNEIRQLHRSRLEKVASVLTQPGKISDVASTLFGEVHGYNELLALEEAGAHVEYLYQRGLLEIANLQELAECDTPLPVVYQSIPISE